MNLHFSRSLARIEIKLGSLFELASAFYTAVEKWQLSKDYIISLFHRYFLYTLLVQINYLASPLMETEAETADWFDCFSIKQIKNSHILVETNSSRTQQVILEWCFLIFVLFHNKSLNVHGIPSISQLFDLGVKDRKCPEDEVDKKCRGW